MKERSSGSQYRFTEEILGEGAFSLVKKCFAADGRPVAIKCIRLTDLQRDRQYIRREVNILEKTSHPAIVKFFGSFQDLENMYLVMELCEGGNLMGKIAQRGKLPESEVQRIASSLLAALRYLHGFGVCHRDLKPENVLFTKEGNAKLTDFGLARILTERQEVSVVGTPYYLAPEVSSGKYSTKCDVWSLGVLLYYALVGHVPFQGQCWEELRDRVSAGVISDWGSVSHSAKLFLLRLLQLDPKVRVSATEALQDPWVNSQF